MELATYSMCARERRWAIAARQDRELLDQIAHVVEGPFHLISPTTFADNLVDFQRVLQERNVVGHVHFGKKANKAGAWLREVARLNGSVDVASAPEFVHSLANGIRGENIGVTGPAKSGELLWLACRHRSTVAIDALDELERVIALAEQAGPMRILLRVLPPQSPNSRFGFSPPDLLLALQRCEEVRQHVIMDGFAFHLDGYAVQPRAEFAAALIHQCLEARNRNFPCSIISIGGGFACSYVDEDDWRTFEAGMTPSQFHADKTFNFFYPYYQSPTGSTMLDAILKTRVGIGTLASTLIAADVYLNLEPGRALLDGAGMTVFPVQGFKRNAEHGMVTVAGLSMSLSEQWRGSEYLPTPILVQRGPARLQKPVRAAVGGSSCLETDIVTWRKIQFPAVPRYGDFLVYPNTAGYQMDKNESEFHQLALPPKIVVTQQDGRHNWKID
ncbi:MULTISPECIES: Y4yA family PLP-dependent enzyme [unclassified Neorhizobium]|uniref:Y4yA family PLP-dependent enzyme n=1 Tax=unclassified Neorhizobium TaxID=2629175 RepID=UPI001FF31CF1|nr:MULTISPECIES: Y4yA family PLP-dependent enzyme [unclassified Neorhizobium]MCJ9673275.1 Y4yA family PLP-dependent enzyme [Neorhizobium sp. SHOUNA12B]MCJ9748663.1 Y4yA family PLP-dependent enzyme [Neorhizobium sp. SHOUNA12A]